MTSSDGSKSGTRIPIRRANPLLSAMALMVAAHLSVPSVLPGQEPGPRPGPAIHGGIGVSSSPIRLAVLPFRAGPGTDPDLARGLAAELAEHLAFLPNITVRTPGSLVGSGDTADLDELAVDFVLRGTVVDTGEQLRVRTEIDGRDSGAGTILDRSVPYHLIVELPPHLVRDAWTALGQESTEDPLEPMVPAGPTDPEAYTLFLRALGATGRSLADGKSTVRALERVATLEPDFAPAYAALGHRHLGRGLRNLVDRREEYDRAERSFRRALALEPELASAIDGLATLYSRTPRQEDAASILGAALVVHANRSELHSRLGYVLRYAGLLDESMAAYRRALGLDARPANLVEWEGQIAKSLVYLGDYGGALSLQEGLYQHLEHLGRSADEKILFYQGVMHLYAGALAEAVDLFDASWRTDSTTVWSAFGQAYRAAAIGDTTRLLELVRDLETRDVADGERHYRLVHFHALAGRKVEAVERLRAALAAGFFAYPYIVADPFTESLRDEPAFQEVLDEIRAKHEAFRDHWFGSFRSSGLDDYVPLDTTLSETVVRIPVRIENESKWTFLVGTTYRPAGDGPFPLIVLSHGSPSNAEQRTRMGRFRKLPRIQALVDRGFAVIVPMRRGFGDSGGQFAERVGPCDDPDFLRAGHEAARDLLATVAFAAKLPYVRRDRIILMGQSAGGYASVAAAASQPPGVVAAVNMSGGRAGRGGRYNGESCAPELMRETIARFATTIRVPILWHYSENDQYFGAHHVRNWFSAYTEAGGRGKLVMRPPFGDDGHRMFASPDGLHLWTSALDEFLEEIGFWEREARPFALVIHGGGGSIPGAAIRAETEASYKLALRKALDDGYRVLKNGGAAIDAVEAAIRVMEDSPLFNAGKGSAFNRDGYNELDASIMDGSELNAGAAAIVQRVKNPITLARAVMERSPHVLLVGEGADRFAREQGLEVVPHHYFFTDRRWDALERRLRDETPYGGAPGEGSSGGERRPDLDGDEFGTVGAVALDVHGNIAAGTSTGGRVGKLPGRVGDSPILGAGTYADNRGAAVSSTGLGEFVLRALSARSVSDLVRVEGFSVQDAVAQAVADMRDMGGMISLIAIDRNGNIGVEIGHEGMYRGYVTRDGVPTVLIWDEREGFGGR